MISNVLNLREQKFDLKFDLEKQVDLILDRFISQFLNTKQVGLRLKIIVGKGLNSKRFINKKTPLRFHTENYLRSLSLRFSDAPDFDGGYGVILVDM